MRQCLFFAKESLKIGGDVCLGSLIGDQEHDIVEQVGISRAVSRVKHRPQFGFDLGEKLLLVSIVQLTRAPTTPYGEPVKNMHTQRQSTCRDFHTLTLIDALSSDMAAGMEGK
jgi:hypothetical protein